ncbi:MAG: TatD family hydrolase [Lautropia sp.]|nr:TatD family hydrolase [Lautropia sp.]
MLIDTHCHLDAPEFDADRDAVVDAAWQAGVGAVVIPAVHRFNWQTVQTLAESRSGLFFALGIHPLYVAQSADDDLDLLRARVAEVREHPAFVGIGEIGLDFFVPGLDLQRQQHFFEQQMRLARDFDLPVILHTRRSVDAVTRQIRRYRPPSGIAHAFNGSPQQTEHLMRLNMALGFGGAMTFERARNIRRLAADLPLEHLVLETDAPDIPPAWVHPGRNQPAEVAAIAQVLAALRGLDPGQLISGCAANACRVLPALQPWVKSPGCRLA